MKSMFLSNLLYLVLICVALISFVSTQAPSNQYTPYYLDIGEDTTNTTPVSNELINGNTNAEFGMMAKLQNQISLVGAKLRGLEDYNNKLKNQRAQEENNIVDGTKAINDLKKDRQEQEKNKQILEDENNKLNNEIDKLRGRLDSLSDKSDHINGKLREIIEDIRNDDDKAIKQDDDVLKHRANIRELQDKERTMSHKIEETRNELEKLENGMRILKKSIERKNSMALEELIKENTPRYSAMGPNQPQPTRIVLKTVCPSTPCAA